MRLVSGLGPPRPADAAQAQQGPKGANPVYGHRVNPEDQKSDIPPPSKRGAPTKKRGHLEGAIRLIDTDITSESILAQHVKSKDAPVLFYCNGVKCGRAAKATLKAVGWGYSNVYYYALGMEEWKDRQLPLVR